MVIAMRWGVGVSKKIKKTGKKKTTKKAELKKKTELTD
jgi:hypothetical protein